MIKISGYVAGLAMATLAAVADVTAGEQRVNIAVLDLQAQGLPTADAQVIASQLRYELFQSGLFTVVERSEMDQVLKEQGFQQSGCTSDQCAVEIGQLLGVQQMAAGSLGAAGSYYILNIRFVDIATGKVVANESIKTKNSMDVMIDKGIKELIGGLRKTYAAAPPSDSTAVKKKKSPARIIVPVAGAVVAGGAAAAVILLGGKDDGSSESGTTSLGDIPEPAHPQDP